MLFSGLPLAVKSRVPRLLSFRRSPSLASSASSSRSSSGASTPEQTYREMALLGDIAQDAYSTRFVMQEEDVNAALSLQARVNAGEYSHDTTGISWTFANPGFTLLATAATESSRFGNEGLIRQLYIHAVTYLLRGLPADLTMDEQLSIRASLPAVIAPPANLEAGPGGDHHAGRTRNQRSLLHRTVASSIVQIFIIFQYLRPYFAYLLATAYEYDREHRVVRRVVIGGVETLDRVGKSSMAVTGLILGIGDGKVGQVAARATKWLLEGVLGGIQDGVEEISMLAGDGVTQGNGET